MPNQIIWSPSAERDLSGILNYLFENWNEKTVRSFIERTENLIHQISINPRQFPIINRKLKIRKCVLTKQNTLYYRERKGVVDILKIFDTRQKPDKLQID